MKKPVLLILLTLGLTLSSPAQENVSAATGVSVLRNFSPQQKFWAIGHTVQANLHLSAKQSIYAWVEYYSDGTFENSLTATTKLPFVLVPQRSFTAKGRLTYRHFSVGWKHYFKGGYADEQAVSVYGLAGFGFLFAGVQNEVFPAIDTTLYSVPTIAGETTVRKLTFDLGLGAEMPLSANLFAFADARTWLPASSNESRYLHNQRNVPLSVMLSAGLRVLIAPAR